MLAYDTYYDDCPGCGAEDQFRVALADGFGAGECGACGYFEPINPDLDPTFEAAARDLERVRALEEDHEDIAA